MVHAALIGLRAHGAGVGVRILPSPASRGLAPSSSRKSGLEDHFRLKIAGLAPQNDESLFRLFFANKLVCFALYQGVEFQGDARGNSIVGTGLATDSQNLDVARIYSFLNDRLAFMRRHESPPGRMVVPIDNFDEADFLPSSTIGWLTEGDQGWRSRSVIDPNIVFLKPDATQFTPDALAKAAASFLSGSQFLSDSDIYFGSSERLMRNAGNEDLEVLPFDRILNSMPSTADNGAKANQGLASGNTAPSVRDYYKSVAPQHHQEEVGFKNPDIVNRLDYLDDSIRVLSNDLRSLKNDSLQKWDLHHRFDGLARNWPIYVLHTLLLFVLIYLGTVVSRTAGAIDGFENSTRNLGDFVKSGNAGPGPKFEVDKCFEQINLGETTKPEQFRAKLKDLKKCVDSEIS